MPVLEWDPVRADIQVMSRATPLLVIAIAVSASGCVVRGHHQTERELRAERLVQLQTRDDVTCRDVHAVNTDVVPDAPVNYMCRNARGEDYAAVVTADGLLTSLSGPSRFTSSPRLHWR